MHLTLNGLFDLADKGVRVNAVIPAEVMTPMYQRWLDTLENPNKTLHSIEENIPFGKRMTTDREIADAVVFLASPDPLTQRDKFFILTEGTPTSIDHTEKSNWINLSLLDHV